MSVVFLLTMNSFLSVKSLNKQVAMQNIWLSIIMPTYNGEKYLRYALNSIENQELTGVEVIAIDDCSTDQTISILENYQHKIPLRVETRKSGNWVSNTNYALSLAKGNYICFLHQDDMWLPQRLSILKKITSEYPEIGLFLHASVFVNAQGNVLGTWNCPLPAYPKIMPSELLIKRLLTQNFISIPGTLFKRNILDQIEKMDETLWYTADWDLWLSMASKTDAVYLPNPLSAFRIHANSQTATRSFNTDDFKKQLESVFQKHFSKIEQSKSKKNIREIAEFSIELNTSLAKILHKEKVNYLDLIALFLKITPFGWYRFFRDSRILERVLPRLKVKLK